MTSERIKALIEERIASIETEASEHRDTFADEAGVFWKGEHAETAMHYEGRLAALRALLADIEGRPASPDWRAALVEQESAR